MSSLPSSFLPTPAAVETPPARFPCAPGQRRFWVLNQLQPGNPALNVAVRWQIDGELPTAILERAFRILIARHDALRMTFVEVDGEPMQEPQAEAAFRIQEIDLGDRPEVERQIEAERIAEVEARTSFDLGSAAPFMRATRLWVQVQRSILLLTAHHLICDGWSLGVLARELGEVCAALQAGRVPRLQELPLGYGEYCEWQAETYGAPDADHDDAFWKTSLAGLKHFELLPDRPRPPVQTAHGALCTIILESTLTARLADLGRRHGCTLYMTALAAFLTLLHRYSGETDIAIGTQVTNRVEAEVEALVGLFVNTLVLRVDLDGDPDFPSLLARVRDAAGEVFSRQQMPLEKIVDLLRPPRDPSRPPLFSIDFQFQKAFVEDARHPRFALAELPAVSAGAMYDLHFLMAETRAGWRVCCEYNTDLFEAATVARFLACFETLLGEIAADPQRRISRLPILRDAERETLIAGWNRTEAEYPRTLTTPQLFEAQARATPEAPALICGDLVLSYRTLEARAESLAQKLRARSLGPGDLVGVLVERSPELVIALLATLKSGAAYVPLDPAYPPERLAHVIDSSKMAALLSRPGLRDALLPDAAMPLVDVGEADAAESADPPPARHATPQDRAYVIYTSGSTGKPKGVQIAHGALVNLLWAMRERPGLAAGDAWLAVTTVSFDIAALEIFLPLIVGARLVIAREHEVADGAVLLDLIKRHGIGVMQATPVSWQLLIEAGWRGEPKLKALCGGEAMPRPLADALIERGAEVWNLYGPTETTIWSSALRVAPGGGSVPLGGPIANTRFYVLDAHRKLVPPGVPGELYIGGDGVALGYLGLDELTRERFLADEFQGGDARMYRTGDIVRLRSAANDTQANQIQHQLEYLGRADNQVKLRGFRIELGEIETTLREDPQVADAAAIVGRDRRGEGALWAYVVARETPAPATLAVALRERLGARLPRYMCPSAIVVLDSLPRTPNGKIDRRALPPPAPVEETAAPAAPLSESEARIAAIWDSVLDHPVRDPRANFFEEGGHSLLAARMLARVQAEFGAKVTLAALFKAPTLRELAQLIETADAREYDFRAVVKLQPNGARTPLIAINNTGIYYLLSKHLGAEQPFTSLQLFDPSQRSQELPRRFEDIAAAYVQLIRRVQAKGPYALLGWCVAGTLAFEIARQLAEEGQEVSQLALIDTYVPGYLERLPRLRGWLADYSYRWQLIVQDWSRTWRGRQSWEAFLAKRTLIRKLLALFSRRAAAPVEAAPRDAAEDHDQWLLAYLTEAEKAYWPKPYAGRMRLFRSTQEPHGRFLAFDMGWGAYARGGVEVLTIEGDHFSMFREPGVAQMAAHLGAALEPAQDKPARER